MAPSASPDTLFFEGFRLEPSGLFQLDEGGDKPVVLGSRALDLLFLLARRQGEVLSKDVLLRTVWAGMAIEEGNLTVQIAALRRAIDQHRTRGSCIQTLPGRGYRFTATVTQATKVAAEGAESRLTDKPSVAVLPFTNLSEDAAHEYFADGMAEEIITALSRVRWLFVIARNSTFTYKGQAVDVRQVGRELSVRYVLEGSVRRDGSRLRIAVQLIDAETGTHLWADRFDGSLESVFDFQDRVAIGVAGVIEPTLQAAEMRRSVARPTANLSAYDFYLRALALFFPIARERICEALELLERAIAIDRQYGLAASWAAICHARLVIDGWADAPEISRARAIELARQALQETPDDPGVLANAAFVLVSFGEDVGTSVALIERALALNPSYARGWHLSGQIRLMAGQYDRAIADVETALRLSPRERIGPLPSVMGRAYFFKRRFGEAAEKLLLAIQENPAVPHAYRFLASCYSHMGRLDDARAVIARLHAITDQVMPANPPWRNANDHELLLSGLRLAMLGAA